MANNPAQQNGGQARLRPAGRLKSLTYIKNAGQRVLLKCGGWKVSSGFVINLLSQPPYYPSLP